MNLPTRALSLGLLFCATVFESAGQENVHTETVRFLEKRQAEQVRAARALTAFHDFQFQDRIEASQIRFVHRTVDDAGKTYKAAHYDHGNGLAVGDVDGDGFLDVYFTTQIGTNQLWRNVGNGTFEDITAGSGLGLVNQISVAASFADIDNDGDPDLYVTTVRHGNHLFENRGGGHFRDITQSSGLAYSGHSSAAVFFDADSDGRLDLLLINVGKYTIEQIGPDGYWIGREDAFFGHLYPDRSERSILYRNVDGRTFKDVSAQFGLGNSGWSGDASFADLNGDGFPDLYVLNMQGDDHYYENQRGKGFVEKTAQLFPKTPWGAMGIKFFDYNQDGLIDLLLTDMHSDMTKDHTTRASNFGLDLEKAKSESFCAVQWTESYLQGSSNNIFGNALYRNAGGGRFVEVSDSANVETYWPWGVSVGDLNADGFEDVFVTAGMGYPFRYGVNSVLLNDAGRRFFDAEFILGVEPRIGQRTHKYWFVLDCDGADRNHPLCAGRTGRQSVVGALSTRSATLFDLDEDGDLDIVTNEFGDHPQVLVSNLAGKRSIHYLKIKLVGTKSNRDGLGAFVKVHTPGHTWSQSADGKSGYLSQSSMPLYFGLGDATAVDSIEVRWPSGQRSNLGNPGINRTVRMVEGTQ